MGWNPNDLDSEILAVHAALVPNGPEGEVVFFGGDEHWSAQQESAGNDSWKKTRVYDVASHSLVSGQVQSPDSDVFCAHHVFVGDGRLLIAGGTHKWPESDGHDHGLDFLGHSRCWLYNPRQRQWVETARLNRNPTQPNEALSGGRWYPGLVALGDGSAVAYFGHPDQNDNRHRNVLPERYAPSLGGWRNQANDMGTSGEPNSGGRRYLFFVRGYVLPSGRVFSATPLPVEFAAGSEGAHFSTAIDAETGAYITPRASTADGVDDGWNFPSVLLPLLPNGGQHNARVLYWNGAQPRFIDTDAASPAWTNAGARAVAGARIYSNSILLPTGQVCAIGGVSTVGSFNEPPAGGTPEVGVNQVELYTPDIDWATNSYTGAGSWSLEAGTSLHTRNYHSAALLLPNGKVWVGGGSIRAAAGNPDTVGVKRIELYEPPYIAVAGRIQIQNAPRLLPYGRQFDVQIDRAASNVARAALIRCSSVTHATDNDQRYVGLTIVSRTGNAIRLEAPPTGNVAPPGYYMLWLIDTDGNPCMLARFVRLGHLSCRVIADRSTFSKEEVQALGGGANATFAGALYVDYDGFLDAELSSTPSFALDWMDGAGAVPTTSVTLQYAGRYTEANPPNPDIPTRITYKFDVIFPTMDAYPASMTDPRSIRVRFTNGDHVCQSQIDLTVSPNPYMIDVEPGVANPNPHWLSTDVRVFKVRAGQSRFGVTIGSGGNAPWDYIRTVIDRFRSGSENFNAIAASGNDTTLDGAFMSGWPPLPTFNFAVARVRYRAISTPATDVRCFFRLCNVAATGLAFDTNTVYRTGGTNPVPLLGLSGGQVVSIPFFMGQRNPTVSGQPGATAMTAQQLDPVYDIRTIQPNAMGAEVTEYFGCFLDINLPTKRFPLAPVDDGPFPESSSLPIRDMLRSWHNCLVAEILLDGDPTRPGAGPGDSDNLAQRNLSIIGLENPGLSASRTAMHSFEIAPSRAKKGEVFANPNRPGGSVPGDTGFIAANRGPRFPDELFFDWPDLPADTRVTLYFSDIDTAEIEELLSSRVSPPAFTILDEHTLRFRIGDCAWLPIPAGREVRIPVLVSIELPDGIIEGQVYRATIRQVDGRANKVVGSITIEMPVSKAAFLRPEAERQLSFMGHILTTLSPSDRWRPIFERLVAHLGSRVDALGGNSSQVEPNPDGTGKPYEPINWEPGDPFPPKGFGTGGTGGAGHVDGDCKEDCPSWPGWLIAALLALALLLLGIAPLSAALVAALLAVIGIAWLGHRWSKLCRGPGLCRLLDALLLGSVGAAGILGVGLALGGQVRVSALIASSLVALGAALLSFALRCRFRC